MCKIGLLRYFRWRTVAGRLFSSHSLRGKSRKTWLLFWVHIFRWNFPSSYRSHEIINFPLTCSAGLFGRLSSVLAISLPTILKFGSNFLKQKVAKDCLYGEKQICWAITEPYGGSDVAGLKTSAIKSECGKFYIVNGMKKWISGK